MEFPTAQNHYKEESCTIHFYALNPCLEEVQEQTSRILQSRAKV